MRMVTMKTPLLIGYLAFLCACNAHDGVDAMNPVAQDTDNGVAQMDLPDTQNDTMDGASNTAETTPLPPLTFVWNTNYSSYLVAPDEVRSAARIACEARGYDIAVMASMELSDDQMEAGFTCRGGGGD